MKNMRKTQLQNDQKLKLGRRVVRVLTEAELEEVTGGTHTLGECPTRRARVLADG